jgi:DNA-binding transcriptional LysR family regulator
MLKRINLRQIEAFKAVVENGTVSRGAEMMNISQPAMSQLIGHMELDSGLKLFDRVRGRLVPTERAMRLYDEISRIFAGVRQVENAIEGIKREEQGRLAIGIIPALASSFVPNAIPSFLKAGGDVFCSLHQMSSQWILEWLIAKKLDVGLIVAGFDHPYVALEPLLEHPLVCIMPKGHPLAAKSHIEPQDLDKIPFVSLHVDTHVGRRIADMFETYRIKPQTVMVANVAPSVCECVAAGLGVSLAHPLSVSGREHLLTVRRFEPEIRYGFQLGRSADSRNGQLIDLFAQELRDAALKVSQSMQNDI